MLGQFILNIFIAALWFLLKDDPNADFTTFMSGFFIGMLILYAMHRFFGTQFYLRRVVKILKLILLFIRELLMSSMEVLKQVLDPQLKITPGIFTYETCLEGDWQITVLALLLTLTPYFCRNGSIGGRQDVLHSRDGHCRIEGNGAAFNWQV